MVFVRSQPEIIHTSATRSKFCSYFSFKGSSLWLSLSFSVLKAPTASVPFLNSGSQLKHNLPVGCLTLYSGSPLKSTLIHSQCAFIPSCSLFNNLSYLYLIFSLCYFIPSASFTFHIVVSSLLTLSWSMSSPYFWLIGFISLLLCILIRTVHTVEHNCR